MSKINNNNFVLVTTDKDKKGVFGGYLKEDKSPDYVILERARMAVYWSQNVKSVLGLAATGPIEGCKISLSVPEIKLYGITSITLCSDKAVRRWEEDVWTG